jgi:hypothetical protein
MPAASLAGQGPPGHSAALAKIDCGRLRQAQRPIRILKGSFGHADTPVQP